MKTMYLTFLTVLFASNLWANAPECAGADVTLTTDQQCCTGLKLNTSTNTCVDASPIDTTLMACNSHAQCGSQGNGCFPQRYEDLFLENEAGDDELGTLDNDPKADGAACVRNSDCESYNCVKSTTTNGNNIYQCKEKLICRLADEGEVAPAPVACEPGLVKNAASSICEVDPDGENAAYLSFDNAVNIKEVVGGNKCDLQVSQSTQDEALAAIKSIRSLEFLLASTPETGEDCLKITKYLRDNLSGFVNERKLILNFFNERFKILDEEAQKVMGATKESSGNISINDKTYTERDVALRKATGIDMLDILRRKNLLYQEYERKMKSLLQKYAVVIKRLDTDLGNFPNHREKEWTIDGVTYKGRNETCRGGGFLGLGRKRIYKRWSKAVKVTNDSGVPTEGVMKQLNIITEESPQSIAKKLGTKNASAWSIVAGIATGGLSQIIANIFGSRPYFIDSLKVISSDSTSSRESFKTKIIDFNKNMVGDSSNQKFVFEPELFDTTNQGCLNNSNYASVAECKAFREYLDGMADVSYAQNVAYSYSKRKNYKHYFNNGDTWRRKLLKHYEQALIYLSRDASAEGGPGYYATLDKVRDQRNKCLEDLIYGIDRNYDSSTSLHEGNNYYVSTTTGGSSGSTQQSSGTKNLTLGDRPKYEFNMGNLTASALKTFGKNDKEFIDSIVGGGKISDASAANAMSTRVKEIKAINDKLTSSGSNLATKEKDLKNQVNSYASGSSSQNSGNSSGSSSSSSSHADLANSGGSASLATSDKTKTDDMGQNSNAKGAASVAIPSAGLSSNIDPYGKSSDSSTSGKNYNDPTGMSDEEKDVMMANYDRNRSQYETKEDDGLFKVISKAYVRSLDKVLTKKKAIEE